LRHDLIKACADTGLPVIVSAGMAHLSEINAVLKHFKSPSSKATILHCVSNYPAIPDDCGLSKIQYINHLGYFHEVGWSDHTCEPGVIHAAVGKGAQVIEFHFDLSDVKGSEFHYGHCWIPEEIKNLIYDVRMGELACEVADTDFTEERQNRADPSDGLRPMKEVR
jgi:N-acetylneuraminate synthase